MQLQLQQQKLMTNGFEEEEDDEEEEVLSLSDLPILGAHHPSNRDDTDRPPEPEDFEFGSWAADDPLMCSADDVFFQGQILPLRPSVCSNTGLLLAACSRPNSQKSSRSGSRRLLPGPDPPPSPLRLLGHRPPPRRLFRPNSQKSSQSGSRSDSMDRSSWGFSSSRSNSNGSSSRRPAATGAYSGFYNHHPSPKPHQGGAQIRRSVCRSGWGRSGRGRSEQRKKNSDITGKYKIIRN